MPEARLGLGGPGAASVAPPVSGPRAVACPVCDAAPRRPCIRWRMAGGERQYVIGPRVKYHRERAAAADRQAAVDDFNRDTTIGTPVRYWTGIREGEGKLGVTRSMAEMLGGHTPVVWVTGHPACIALTHVEPARS